jgi:hypothetical protein
VGGELSEGLKAGRQDASSRTRSEGQVCAVGNASQSLDPHLVLSWRGVKECGLLMRKVESTTAV